MSALSSTVNTGHGDMIVRRPPNPHPLRAVCSVPPVCARNTRAICAAASLTLSTFRPPSTPPAAALQHDCQMDYYSKLMATCSSDCTVRVFDVAAHNANPSAPPLAELRGHDGPVWQISWAHPKFGVLLASCSYDRSVVIWKQDERQQWQQVLKYPKHLSSVNAVKWAPHECGLHLAAASSDGQVSILSYREGAGWQPAAPFEVSNMGCNAVDWAPHAHLGSVEGDATVARLVTASCDNKVKIWKAVNINDATATPIFTLDTVLPGGHDDWVRDVAWAYNTGMPCNTIASCSEDKRVIIWSQRKVGGEWAAQMLQPEPFPFPVWRVSWSVTGAILACAAGDSASSSITLWKESWESLGTSADGDARSSEWQQISEVDEAGSLVER